MAASLGHLAVMWVRRGARLVAGIALFLATALLLLQTAPAKRWIADELSAELSDATGYPVSVGSLEGRLPFSASALDVAMADANGEWLRLQRLDVTWSPFALLSGRLQIDSVIADRVMLSRLPLAPPETEESADDLALDLRLPELPWPTRVEDFRIGRFEVAPAVLGEPAALSLAANMSVESATDAALELKVQRVDAQPGQAAIALRMAQEPAEFALKADLAEPAGGLIARMLELPGLPPVQLSLDGSGPAAAWRGKLAASAGDAALDVDLGIGYGPIITLAADGKLEPGRTLQAGTDLLPPAMDTSMRVQWQPGHRFAVERFKLASAEAQADISGAADLDAGQVQVAVELRIANAARWQRWFAPVRLGAGQLSGSLSGPLERPQFKLSATAENLALPEASAQQARLEATGRVGIQDLHLLTDLTLDANGGFEGLAITDGEPWADLIGPAATWSVKGSADLQAGDLQIEALNLRSGKAEIGGSGSLAAFGQRIAASLNGELADIAPLARLADFDATGAASLRVQLQREAAAPMRLTLDGRLRDASVGDPTLQALLGRAPVIAGAVALDDDEIRLSDVKLSGAGGALIANGRTDLRGQVLDLTGDLEVFRIAPLLPEAGIAADGHLTATAKVSRSRRDEPLALTADARVDGLAPDSPLAPLIGSGIDGHFDGAYDGDTLRIASATLKAAKISLTADGTLGDEGAIDYDLRLPELAALTPVLGLPIAGDARATGTVSGPMADPRATADVVIEQPALAGVSLDRLTGQLAADKVASAPTGNIALTFSRGRVNGAASSDYAYSEGALTLRKLQASAPGAKIAGNLTVSPAGLLSGKLAADSDNLKPLGALAGYDLSGATHVDLDLTSAHGAQGVAADLTARNLALAEPGGRWLIGRAAMKGRFTDVFGRQAGTADLTIAEASHNGLAVETALLTVNGRSAALRFEQSASGTWDRPFSFKSAGEVALLSRETRLRLDRFAGRFDELTAELHAPVTLRQDRAGIAVDDLNLAIAGGTLRGGGRLGAPAADFRLNLRDVPLETAAIAFPDLPFAGEVGADLTVSGPPNRPTALLDVDLADVRERDAAVGESVALTGQGRLEIRDNRGTLQATVKSGTGLSATATGSAPMRFRLDPFELAPDVDGPLAGRVQGQLDLALVPQVIDLYGDSAGGRLDADVAVAGSLAKPQLSGEARISNGAYENAQSGAVLRDLEAVLRGAGDRLELVSLSATDGEAGRLSGDGFVRFIGEGDMLYDADLRMTRFKLLRRNDMSATLGGDLRLGRDGGRTELSGKLTIEEAELRIPDRLPREIARLEVEQVNLPADKAAMVREPPRQAAAPLLVDVTITAPGRSFLRGRGLDSEWRGQLHLSETLAAPSLVGKLEVVRGTIDLVGTIFRIQQGTVTFSGDDDPDLDILGVASAAGEIVRLNVTGRASAPKFALSSESGLPSDEILARLMFGKGTGGLSPLQAAQLVQAVAALSGSSEGSVIDRFRQRIGIDVLSVESTDQTVEGASLRAGKYISEDVFMKVEQGLTPESRKVGVEVRVLPQITVDGDVAATGDSSVGVNWRYDY
jgi:translocation and assembly module TamB